MRGAARRPVQSTLSVAPANTQEHSRRRTPAASSSAPCRFFPRACCCSGAPMPCGKRRAPCGVLGIDEPAPCERLCARVRCRTPLQFEDMWRLPPQDEVAGLSERFERAWHKELQKPTPSLVGALLPAAQHRTCVASSAFAPEHPCEGLPLLACRARACQQCGAVRGSLPYSTGLPGAVHAADGFTARRECFRSDRMPHRQDLLLLYLQMLAIWKTTWGLFVGALPFKLVNDAATFVGPVFLNLLLVRGHS